MKGVRPEEAPGLPHLPEMPCRKCVLPRASAPPHTCILAWSGAVSLAKVNGVRHGEYRLFLALLTIPEVTTQY